ncbi:PREDICTED: uncharacterized protein LOC109589884, partial [Amphimedon queenslandica]|uniref:Nuclear pore complex protein Nup85 n=1 Tax=Amphimedon queenslandica TaxID=400682 RepID=A0AAN0JWH7_AMPQE
MADVEYDEHDEERSSASRVGAGSGYNGDEEEEEATSSLTMSEVHTRGRVLLRTNPRNSIAIFTAPYDDDDDDNYSNSDKETATSTDLYEVQWSGIVLTTDSVRKLVSQSHAFFMELQEYAGKGMDPDVCVKYSRLYRVALYECTQGLNYEC